MRFYNIVNKLNYLLEKIILVLVWIASISLTLMILIIVGNVIGRYLFAKPILGSIEIVSLLTVVLVFCVFGFAESEGAHIAVTIISSRIDGFKKMLIMSLMFFLGAIFFTIMGWQGLELMYSYLFPTVRATSILSIPFAPFILIMAFGCFIFSLELLVHGFYTILPSEKRVQEPTK